MQKKLLALMLSMFSSLTFAQNAPGSETVQLTLASIKQPLLPVWYPIIYGSIALVAIFFIIVIVQFLKKK